MEEWRDIKGYEGLYQVSNKGRVKSLNRIDSRGNKVNEKILRPIKQGGGYLFINLYKNGKGKKYRIHRLVAEHFIPNPNNLPVVNHKDENKLNNNVENLEWCTQEYNVNYSGTAGRPGKRVICVETQQIFDSSEDVIRKMFDGNGSSSTIREHLRGRLKSAYKYHFKFVE